MSIRKTLTQSQSSGANTPALIEQTIGAFFDDMAERYPEREALVAVHQKRRYT